MDAEVVKQIRQILDNNKVVSLDGCFIWPGSKTAAGYGQVWLGKSTYYVHRLSASIYLNLNLHDEDILVCHRTICKNSNCWNPEHLYLGDDKTNGEDRASLITHCINGHEFTPENTYIAMNARYPKRQCRKCKAIRESQRRERKRHGEES